MDYETWTRKKINDKFEFPLELDMTQFCESGGSLEYELKSIVVHRGGPYGGHYFAYMRDDLGQGNWDLKIPERFADEPTEKEQKPEEAVKEPEPEASGKAGKKKNKGKNK
jgi:ubiquitin carboxyl-terminal hydrolase 40